MSYIKQIHDQIQEAIGEVKGKITVKKIRAIMNIPSSDRSMINFIWQYLKENN